MSILKSISKVNFEEKIGEQCLKHSMKRKEDIGRGGYTSEEVIPFSEVLGVHPVDIVINKKTGNIYCPECKRQGVREQTNEIVNKSMLSHQLEDTSKMLKSRSVLVDETIKRATFDNFKISDTATKTIKEKAVGIVDEILNGSIDNYLFVGDVGRGKSHIAMAIANKVNIDSYRNGKAKACVFISIHEMISRIHYGYGMSDEEYRRYRYKDAYFKDLADKADVLVLDDLGSELGQINSKIEASNSVSKILNSILEARQGKVTIITTNLSESKIKAAYGDRVDSRLKDGLKDNAMIFTGTTDKRTDRP